MRARAGMRAFGWFLLLVPFVPLAWLFGEIDRTRGLVPPSEALLGLFVFGCLAVLGARLLPARVPERVLQILDGEHGPGSKIAGGAVLLLLALLLVTAVFAFARRPLLIDSVIQWFQAQIFASGRLYADAPPDEAFFAVQHMLVDGSRWYSQYPPGHSALLGLGAVLGVGWLVPVALSVGTSLVLYAFTRRAYDLATARTTVVVLALAPFFWFMGASHMNHVSALFFVAVFLYLLVLWEERGSPWILCGAGLAIGAGFLSRPLTALAVGIALTPFVLARARRERDAGSVLAGAVGALAMVALYLAYNSVTTGDPFLPGYIKLWGADHGLGFHSTPWGEMHSPLAGVRNELTDLALLSSLMFEGPVSALLPAGLLFAAGWASKEWDQRLMVGFLAIPLAYLFYWHRDAFLGPRYLYSGLAFLAPLTARGLLELFRRTAGRTLWEGSALTRVPVASAAGMLLVLSFVYAAAYSTPRRFQVYRSGLASMKVDLAAEARASSVEDALVFVSVSWGNRLLARMRGLGVSASGAETAYRQADHCALELTLQRAETEGWSRGRTAAAVADLGPGGETVPASSPLTNGDPTLRLVPGVDLPADCLDQIAYDRAGYSNYSPFLADQDPSLEGPLVIARDLRERNRELTVAYPHRRALVYRSGRFSPLE
ncbi:MAG: glycosyltransferase family 39 protein [marine benthic group bacterium]|nr:glycosyltransferase family 39 protein [Gemmatimonadota bacterium]